jgi:phytoene desaturase
MPHPSAPKHIIVVGAGPGGLTSAMILARRGFRVTLFEARDQVGGRNAEIRLGPYVFDTGPTFLMMKQVLEEVFLEAGSSIDKELTLNRIEPMYRLQFKGGRHLDPTTDPDGMVREIKRVFPGHEDRYAAMMKREKDRFNHLLPCLQKSYSSLSTLAHPDLIRALPHLALGRSLFDVMQGYFQSEELALSFTFQAKYLGMSPWECPGLFAIIPYIEHAFGIYHTRGGLSRISDAMAAVAERNGAVLRLGTPVKRVLVKDRKATGVLLENGETVEADAVVLNADFGHAATHLFEPGVLRTYTPETLAKKRFSCSTFMMYLGLDIPVSTPHHLIVFADDYRAHMDSIFSRLRLVKDVSFYIRHADATDSSLAPAGHSALYVLVPVPNNRSGIDWEQEREAFRDTVLGAIESRTPLGNLRPHIRAEKIITPLDWERDYRIYAGATFNLAHNLGQMIFLRPRNKFEEIDRCYLVGGGTHPGSGLPTIYESGRIAANLISHAHGVPVPPATLKA